jgi:hypothetical protein
MSEYIVITAAALKFLDAYNNAHNATTWVIHTPKDSTIGGFSAEFVGFVDDDNVILKHASGDTYTAPISNVTIRVAF